MNFVSRHLAQCYVLTTGLAVILCLAFSCEASHERGARALRPDLAVLRPSPRGQPLRVAFHRARPLRDGLRGRHLPRPDRPAHGVPHETPQHHPFNGENKSETGSGYGLTVLAFRNLIARESGMNNSIFLAGRVAQDTFLTRALCFRAIMNKFQFTCKYIL